MRKQHLSEEEIQQYTFAMGESTLEVGRHLGVCEQCRAKVDTYKLLFSEIDKEPAPVFDFNVAEHVLPQLETPKPEFSWSGFWIYTLAILGVFLIGVAIYGLRSLFTAILSTHLYLPLASFCLVLVVLLLDYYKKFRERIKLLEFY